MIGRKGLKPVSAFVPAGETAIRVPIAINISTPVTESWMTQRRPLGGRIVPLLFLPVPRITTGCLRDVVVLLREGNAPVCGSARLRLRVTRGDVSGPVNDRVVPGKDCCWFSGKSAVTKGCGEA